jgi:hypothetical protein
MSFIDVLSENCASDCEGKIETEIVPWDNSDAAGGERRVFVLADGRKCFGTSLSS